MLPYMEDDYPKNYSGIQDERDNGSSIFDYRDEAKAFGAASIISGGIMLPAEISEDVYGPSDLYHDSAEITQDLYVEGSEWIHEGVEISFDVISSLL